MQPPTYLVLFDIDGTLLDSGGCGRAALRLTMTEIFGTVGAIDRCNFAGKTDWLILLESLAEAGVDKSQIQAQIAAYNTALARNMTGIIADFPVQPCPGGHEVVAALRDNPAALIGLVTGNMSEIVPLKLRAAGYDPADFKIGAFGSEGWNRSMLPPLALERAEAYSGVIFAPEHVIVIGDTPADISCAASIGARTLAVGTGPFTADELRAHHPTYAFDSMADRDAVLAAILNDGQQSA